MGPARNVTGSLTPDPELENSQGHEGRSTSLDDISHSSRSAGEELLFAPRHELVTYEAAPGNPLAVYMATRPHPATPMPG